MKSRGFEEEASFLEAQSAEIEGDNDDRGFLRYAWTRSLAEWNAADWDKRMAEAGPQIYPGPEVAHVQLTAARLLKAINAANVAGLKQRWRGRGPLFDQTEQDFVRKLLCKAEMMRSEAYPRKTASRPRSRRRLYFVSAMLPFIRWRGITPAINDPHSRPAGKIWIWFDQWERQMGAVGVDDHGWLRHRIHSGGITARDLRQGRHLHRVQPDSGSTRKWWQKASRRMEDKDDIIDFAGCYIGWRRRVFRKKSPEEGTVASTARLSGDELAFAKFASSPIARECKTTATHVMDRWQKIRF